MPGPPIGSENWGPPLNAAIEALETGVAGKLAKSSNLSDLTNAGTARTNLGLGDSATRNVGTTAGTVAAGDDSRFSNTGVPTTRQIIAGTGLTGGGDLSADRTLTVVYGTTGTTATVGDDSRVTGAAQKSANLSDLANASTARTNLGLGGAATLSVGTTAGTVAAGDDSRITGAAQKASNLSDLASATAARTNLGVPPSTRTITAGTGLTGGGDLSTDRTLTVAYGTTSTTAAVGNDTRITGALQTSGGTMTGSLDSTSHALGITIPADHGLAAWSFDPAVATNGATVTNGTVYLSALFISRSFTATKLLWGINTAGVTPTASQNFVGLYNSSGTRLASVGVDARVTATGCFTETISQAVTPGLYWVGFVFNAATPPQLYRSSGLADSLCNAGISAAASRRYAINGTSQTSLPASITPGSNAASAGVAWWVALG